jgi:2-keto-3-deoxy-L-rhamnonate aldolase RhmA/predicted neuraminidase
MRTETRIGTWLSVGSPVIAELAALSGFDWVLLDLEHGNASEAGVPEQVRALRGSHTKAIVRVGAPQADLIARVLDWGADGIMVPHVSGVAEAEAVVRAAYYPPRGRRGVSRTVRAHDYGLRAPESTPAPLLMAQIETLDAVNESAGIALVEGIDVLFVGPADLQHDLRHRPVAATADFEECLRRVVAAAHAAGKAAGLLVRDPSELPQRVKQGFTCVAVQSDLAILRDAFRAMIQSTSLAGFGIAGEDGMTPSVIMNPGAAFQDDARPGTMILGMDRTPKGRIWGCWTGTGDKEDGYFLLATSDDDGATWSKPRLAVGVRPNVSQQPYGAVVGNLWTDPKGRLWLFFNQKLGDPQKRITNWFMRCDDPDAAKPVWSKPVMFAEGCTLNKPTVLKDGAWLLPVSDWHRKTARVFASTDEGSSWQERGSVQFPNWNFDEHMMVELKDGRLWMLARTSGQPHESFSSDGGKTWSAPKQAATVQNVNSRFFLRRLKSGRILLVKNGPVNVRLPRRSHMTAFLSDDEGKSWSKGLLLDERAWVSYPDGFEAPDGLIHILYDWNRHEEAEILMAKFREEDILAGKIISKDAKLRMLANKARAQSVWPDPKWTAQGIEDAKQDFKSIPYDGVTPNKMVCNTTLRELPDGSWILFMLAGGDTEPSPLNYTGVTRSFDKGKTWTPLERFDVGFPREGKTIGQGPTGLMILGQRSTLFFSTHSGDWAKDWRSWFLTSDDSFKTWSKPQEVTGRLKERTFIGKHIVCKDGRIMIPFQHYIGPDDEQNKPLLDRALTNPRNGVLISSDNGKTWTEHGNIRLTPNDRYFGWAENDLFEHPDGRITMFIRAGGTGQVDGLGGMLFKAESKDGGKTWPEFATVTQIPNPGAPTTLYNLGGDNVAILHIPNSKRYYPMALWISFDGMKTWPYQRVLQGESVDGILASMNHPDGFVSADKQWLHFAFDDNRRRAVHYSAKLPPLP